MVSDKNELTEVFIEVHHLLHRYHMIQHSKNIGDFDPRRGQGRILAALKNMKSINQSELAFILDIRQQSLGELLQKLEQNGYIKRERSQADKRVIMVELTEKGRRIEFKKPDYSILFDELDINECENLKLYLQKIIKRLEVLINESE